MLFHTFPFAAFLFIVFVLHWGLFSKHVKAQNILLTFASYYFYSCWDYRFTALLIASTLLDFGSGIIISNSQNTFKRKIWLGISLGLNLGLLGFFKYANFFIDSATLLLNQLHISYSPNMLQIILPVGISFYTFHGISYVLDCYYNRVQATKNFSQYSLFVSFFPLLVAGPIERATHLLPQLKSARSFTYSEALKGMKQILWGLFKKLVIADNCSQFATYAFDNYTTLPASNLILGVFFFSFQIYGDFSGYTDMAIGIGRLFGIELLRNFSFPYFAKNISQFWKRWHISLTSWFRDYLYIPLGGSRGSRFQTLRNTFLVFMVSGFWHGANFTFLVWGFLHFLYFIPHLFNSKKSILENPEPSVGIKHIFQIGFTFTLVSFAWIFFRAQNLSEAFGYIHSMVYNPLFVNPFSIEQYRQAGLLLVLISFFIVIEWIGKKDDFAIEKLVQNRTPIFKYSAYGFLVFLILMYMKTETSTFIYFQF
ncbi:MAG: membrane-bound O-acyltransferase family protein [Bacteroidetes bacterium B1(2017)]|nr:MAG: membrane-bound O-acyltransferase family protein [Bacteroidetes bacterium B1(2017)]